MNYVKASRYLAQQNAKYPVVPVEIPKYAWPKDADPKRIKEFRSRDFLIQVFEEADGVLRLSFNRTSITPTGEWTEGISWDDLQWLKSQIGYQDRTAVEIYPPSSDVVNVANLRHLWVLPYRLPFEWRADATKKA